MRDKNLIFEEIYRDHLHKVQFYAYHYLHDKELAHEITQEVFLKIWDTLELIDLHSDILPYLITLTKNRCLNIIKHNKIVNKYNNYSKQFLIDNQFLNKSIGGTLYTKEIEKVIVQSLNKMNPKVKEVFIQSRFSNKTYQEIAEVYNISVKTVEYRIAQALRILRIGLKDYLHIIIVTFISLKHLFQSILGDIDISL